MKKTIIFLLAAAVMVCMAGCSSSGNAETMPVTERSAATEKVTESITETESETVLSVEEQRQNAGVRETQPFMNLYKRNKDTGIFDIKHSYSAPWIWYSSASTFPTGAATPTSGEPVTGCARKTVCPW